MEFFTIFVIIVKICVVYKDSVLIICFSSLIGFGFTNFCDDVRKTENPFLEVLGFETHEIEFQFHNFDQLLRFFRGVEFIIKKLILHKIVQF